MESELWTIWYGMALDNGIQHLRAEWDSVDVVNATNESLSHHGQFHKFCQDICKFRDEF